MEEKKRMMRLMPQSHPACTCADCIQEGEGMFEKLKIMNSKICDLAIKKAEEELKRIQDEKKEIRQRRARIPSLGGPSNKLSKATLMMLVIGLSMTCSEAANKLSMTTG
jgi:hypothetical protein